MPDIRRCPRCGAGNPGGARCCGQCLRRSDAGAEPEPGLAPSVFTAPRSQPKRRSSGAALALSALMPGAGHWYLGSVGAATARVVLFVGLTAAVLAR